MKRVYCISLAVGTVITLNNPARSQTEMETVGFLAFGATSRNGNVRSFENEIHLDPKGGCKEANAFKIGECKYKVNVYWRCESISEHYTLDLSGITPAASYLDSFARVGSRMPGIKLGGTEICVDASSKRVLGNESVEPGKCGKDVIVFGDLNANTLKAAFHHYTQSYCKGKKF